MDNILKDHDHHLLRQYHSASSDLSLLLAALHDELLPQLILQLKLPEQDITWILEWLSDTASVFRLLRRHKFTNLLAMQEIRAISIWRIHVLRPALLLSCPPLFHCLPSPIADPLGHPMLFLKLASLQALPCSAKNALLQEAERLRLHLRHISDENAHSGPFPLQYLLLVDLEGVSMQNVKFDLLSSLLTDIIPRYPGMLAAVFLLNYSWIHSGAWSVAKRILPSSAIARVFFPSKAQLLNYCSTETLPAEYGGSLPTLDQIDDALRSPNLAYRLPSPPLSASPPPPPPAPIDRPIIAPFYPRIPGQTLSAPAPMSLLHRTPSTVALAPFSPRNPFFGYPADASASRPHVIRYVRRGYPQLARTLAVLWWRRWGRTVVGWTCSTGVCVLLWMFTRTVRPLIGTVRSTRRPGIRDWCDLGIMPYP